MNRVLDRLERRAWPVGVSTVFVLVGLLFLFRWGSVFQHVPKLWLFGQDFWLTYVNSSQFVHGHFGAIYQSSVQYNEFPGILVAFAPLGLFSGAFHSSLFEMVQGRAVLLPGIIVHTHGVNASFSYPKQIFLNGQHYVLQTQWTEFVAPYSLALSCTALFAFDALAERMKVARSRRAVLCVGEAVLLWQVSTLWGHPEDALAVALAVYALIFTLDGRAVGAGWLFGVALAFQPLVVLMLPVLVAVVGRKKVVGFLIRSVLPAALLLAPSFIAAFGPTFHTLADQPNSPSVNHRTPWTALAAHLSGGDVAAGPFRIVGILLAVGVGVWVARRWRGRPELVVWSCVLALALRCFTESVMDPYYSWAPLALGVAVSSRASARRFGTATGLAIATMVVSQWSLPWLPWWLVQMGGLTLLLVASKPDPIPPDEPHPESVSARKATSKQSPRRDQSVQKASGRGGSSSGKKPGPRSGTATRSKAPAEKTPPVPRSRRPST